MPPADNQVASFHVMHVLQEVAAFQLKFDFHQLATVFTDEAHGFTVGKLRLQLEHDKAQMPGHSAKEEYDAEFVERSVSQGGISQRSRPERCAVKGPVQRGMKKIKSYQTL